VKIVPKPIIFEWDKGHIDKNLIKHAVTSKESEEVFGNEPHYLLEDAKHSTEKEARFMMWGMTNHKRKLTIIFTIRDEKIRVVSARDMHIKERRRYEKIQKNSNI